MLPWADICLLKRFCDFPSFASPNASRPRSFGSDGLLRFGLFAALPSGRPWCEGRSQPKGKSLFCVYFFRSWLTFCQIMRFLIADTPSSSTGLQRENAAEKASSRDGEELQCDEEIVFCFLSKNRNEVTFATGNCQIHSSLKSLQNGTKYGRSVRFL